MEKMRIEQGDWVVVCDGAKALVFENIGDAKFPNLKTKEVYEQEVPATSEMGTDAPGRLGSSADGRRSAVEQTDWHDEAEKTFLHKLTGHLNHAVEQGQAKSVIVVAPPRALGILRQNYSPQLQKAIRSELGKDYVRMPVLEIEKHLTG